MGIDFISCSNRKCEEILPDCYSFINCSCNKHWCDEECAKEDGFKDIGTEVWHGDEMKSCNYCRKEDVEDSLLLDFILYEWEIDKKIAIRDYYRDKAANV